VVVAWVVAGGAVVAADPPDGADQSRPPSFSADQRNYWAFQRPVRPVVPAASDATWLVNPLDAFVLAGLDAERLKPAPAADRRTLLRRVMFDLVGLPPTPEQVEAFLADPSPTAYEALVDRLLASPQYGERWARHWLDLARFAESDGYKTDGPRPHAWRYRDYVIDALNRDKPYDQFVREQIAGDEIAPDDSAALVASGFNRHWAYEDNARNLTQRRQDILNDVVDTTASVFLGITLACARCHDHKFDPLLQRDYYRMQAFFAPMQMADRPLGSTEQRAAYEQALRNWEEQTTDIRRGMAEIEQPHRAHLRREGKKVFPPDVQQAIDTDPAERTPAQQQVAALAERQMEVKTDAMVARMNAADRKRWNELRDQLKQFDAQRPPDLPVAMAIGDVGREPPKTFLLRRGNWDMPGPEVEPGFLSILDPRPAAVPQPSLAATGTGRRRVLADWIASPDNPLTARVMINRLWQHHFGRGIAATSSDFGLQGDPPTHPELLDWLACELVSRGWSLKAMHRLMVTSATYRQASHTPPGANLDRARRVDPDNTLLWHMPRRRLEGEIIRDAILSASGLLSPRAGGPSIYPEMPPGLSERYGWKPSESAAERNRRSIYVFVRRNMRYPLFEAFDMPDTNESCARRHQTNTSPQAVYLLNSQQILDQARAFAGRLYAEAGGDLSAQVQRGFRIAFGRPAEAAEVTLARDFMHRQTKFARQQPDATKLPLPSPLPAGVDPCAASALTEFCHALLNANEFIYVD
jgi:hypothetical protein